MDINDHDTVTSDEGLSPEELEELAQGAYRAYGAVTDFKNYQGLPMPQWSELPAKIQDAWCAAALDVYNNAPLED